MKLFISRLKQNREIRRILKENPETAEMLSDEDNSTMHGDDQESQHMGELGSVKHHGSINSLNKIINKHGSTPLLIKQSLTSQYAKGIHNKLSQRSI